MSSQQHESSSATAQDIKEDSEIILFTTNDTFGKKTFKYDECKDQKMAIPNEYLTQWKLLKSNSNTKCEVCDYIATLLYHSII